MKLFDKQHTDDRGVSPVLGVALLVAMTVILAGVIGFVVLGVDSGSAEAPQPKLEFKNETTGSATSDIMMTHEGGDKLDTSRLEVKVEGTGSGVTSFTSDEVTAGETEEVAKNAAAGATVRIVWDDPDSDRDTVLAEYTVE
jgi:flagellin-like protein